MLTWAGAQAVPRARHLGGNAASRNAASEEMAAGDKTVMGKKTCSNSGPKLGTGPAVCSQESHILRRRSHDVGRWSHVMGRVWGLVPWSVGFGDWFHRVWGSGSMEPHVMGRRSYVMGRRFHVMGRWSHDGTGSGFWIQSVDGGPMLRGILWDGACVS